MNYWLDLFTGTTWKEFQKAGAIVSGFRPRMRNAATTVKPGDILLCYLTGVMRWVGALEVVGLSKDDRPIWKDEDFPVRFDVKPLVVLQPENGIPMSDLEGQVDFFRGPKDRGKFRGFVRMSPNRFGSEKDGALVLDLLRKAHHRLNDLSTPRNWPIAPSCLKLNNKKASERSPLLSLFQNLRRRSLRFPTSRILSLKKFPLQQNILKSNTIFSVSVLTWAMTFGLHATTAPRNGKVSCSVGCRGWLPSFRRSSMKSRTRQSS